MSTAYKVLVLKLAEDQDQPQVVLELTTDDLGLMMQGLDSARAKIRKDREDAIRAADDAQMLPLPVRPVPPSDLPVSYLRPVENVTPNWDERSDG